jgi:hypothetical protein
LAWQANFPSVGVAGGKTTQRKGYPTPYRLLCSAMLRIAEIIGGCSALPECTRNF